MLTMHTTTFSPADNAKSLNCISNLGRCCDSQPLPHDLTRHLDSNAFALLNNNHNHIDRLTYSQSAGARFFMSSKDDLSTTSPSLLSELDSENLSPTTPSFLFSRFPTFPNLSFTGAPNHMFPSNVHPGLPIDKSSSSYENSFCQSSDSRITMPQHFPSISNNATATNMTDKFVYPTGNLNTNFTGAEKNKHISTPVNEDVPVVIVGTKCKSESLYSFPQRLKCFECSYETLDPTDLKIHYISLHHAEQLTIERRNYPIKACLKRQKYHFNRRKCSAPELNMPNFSDDQQTTYTDECFAGFRNEFKCVERCHRKINNSKESLNFQIFHQNASNFVNGLTTPNCSNTLSSSPKLNNAITNSITPGSQNHVFNQYEELLENSLPNHIQTHLLATSNFFTFLRNLFHIHTPSSADHSESTSEIAKICEELKSNFPGDLIATISQFSNTFASLFVYFSHDDIVKKILKLKLILSPTTSVRNDQNGTFSNPRINEINDLTISVPISYQQTSHRPHDDSDYYRRAVNLYKKSIERSSITSYLFRRKFLARQIIAHLGSKKNNNYNDKNKSQDTVRKKLQTSQSNLESPFYVVNPSSKYLNYYYYYVPVFTKTSIFHPRAEHMPGRIKGSTKKTVQKFNCFGNGNGPQLLLGKEPIIDSEDVLDLSPVKLVICDEEVFPPSKKRPTDSIETAEPFNIEKTNPLQLLSSGIGVGLASMSHLPKLYSCAFKETELACPFRTRNKKRWADHRDHHKGHKSHSCNLCPYKTTWYENLNQHTKRMHHRQPQSQNLHNPMISNATDVVNLDPDDNAAAPLIKDDETRILRTKGLGDIKIHNSSTINKRKSRPVKVLRDDDLSTHLTTGTTQLCEFQVVHPPAKKLHRRNTMESYYQHRRRKDVASSPRNVKSEDTLTKHKKQLKHGTLNNNNNNKSVKPSSNLSCSRTANDANPDEYNRHVSIFNKLKEVSTRASSVNNNNSNFLNSQNFNGNYPTPPCDIDNNLETYDEIRSPGSSPNKKLTINSTKTTDIISGSTNFAETNPSRLDRDELDINLINEEGLISETTSTTTSKMLFDYSQQLEKVYKSYLSFYANPSSSSFSANKLSDNLEATAPKVSFSNHHINDRNDFIKYNGGGRGEDLDGRRNYFSPDEATAPSTHFLVSPESSENQFTATNNLASAAMAYQQWIMSFAAAAAAASTNPYHIFPSPQYGTIQPKLFDQLQQHQDRMINVQDSLRTTSTKTSINSKPDATADEDNHVLQISRNNSVPTDNRFKELHSVFLADNNNLTDTYDNYQKNTFKESSNLPCLLCGSIFIDVKELWNHFQSKHAVNFNQPEEYLKHHLNSILAVATTNTTSQSPDLNFPLPEVVCNATKYFDEGGKENLKHSASMINNDINSLLYHNHPILGNLYPYNMVAQQASGSTLPPPHPMLLANNNYNNNNNWWDLATTLVRDHLHQQKHIVATSQNELPVAESMFNSTNQSPSSVNKNSSIDMNTVPRGLLTTTPQQQQQQFDNKRMTPLKKSQQILVQPSWSSSTHRAPRKRGTKTTTSTCSDKILLLNNKPRKINYIKKHSKLMQERRRSSLTTTSELSTDSNAALVISTNLPIANKLFRVKEEFYSPERSNLYNVSASNLRNQQPNIETHYPKFETKSRKDILYEAAENLCRQMAAGLVENSSGTLSAASITPKDALAFIAAQEHTRLLLSEQEEYQKENVIKLEEQPEGIRNDLENGILYDESLNNSPLNEIDNHDTKDEFPVPLRITDTNDPKINVPYHSPLLLHPNTDDSVLGDQFIQSNNVHQGGGKRQRTHRCTLPGCNFEAYDKNRMLDHLAAHRGEKPHGCPYCEFRTSWRFNIKNHIRSKHPNML